MSWSEQEVQDVWDNFCSSLLEVPEQEETGLTVYPNPASRLLTVGQLDSWTVGQSAVRLSIVDLFGRGVKEYGEISSFPYQKDISELPDGIYILRMTDEEGNESAVKFVKQGNVY